MKPEIPRTSLETLAAVCQSYGVYLLEAKACGTSPSRLKLEVVIDSETGITHDDCRAVSQAIDSAATHDSFLAGIFALDVLSPGAGRAITLPWQYPKHTGRTLRCTLNTGEIHTGKVLETDSTGIVLLPSKQKKAKETPQQIHLLFSDISSSTVMIEL